MTNEMCPNILERWKCIHLKFVKLTIWVFFKKIVVQSILTPAGLINSLQEIVCICKFMASLAKPHDEPVLAHFSAPFSALGPENVKTHQGSHKTWRHRKPAISCFQGQGFWRWEKDATDKVLSCESLMWKKKLQPRPSWFGGVGVLLIFVEGPKYVKKGFF